MTYVIRNYQQEDFFPLLELWVETDLTNAKRADSAAIIENTLKHGGALFILIKEETKELIGSSWISNDGRRLYLHHFGIKPKYQGQKLSHLLMEASMDFALKLGMQIKLEVHNENKKAICLYSKYGFSNLGDYRVMIIRKIKK